MSSRAMILGLGALLVASGCGGKKKGDDEAIVKALGAQDDRQKVDEKALEERRQARMAKEAEAKAAEAKKAAAIDAAATVPEGKPGKDLGKACQAVAEAQDDFMRRHFEGDDLAKWDASKDMQMGMTRKTCQKHGNPQVAACQRHAFESAGPELRKDHPALMIRCVDKFGKADGGTIPPG